MKTTGPKKDDIVTVESHFWSEGEKYYILAEWPKGDGVGYNSKYFRPIGNEQVKYEEVELSKIKERVPMPSVN